LDGWGDSIHMSADTHALLTYHVLSGWVAHDTCH